MKIRLLLDYSMLDWCVSLNEAIVIGYRYTQEKEVGTNDLSLMQVK